MWLKGLKLRWIYGYLDKRMWFCSEQMRKLKEKLWRERCQLQDIRKVEFSV